jgi:hypothetical protein
MDNVKTLKLLLGGTFVAWLTTYITLMCVIIGG